MNCFVVHTNYTTSLVWADYYTRSSYGLKFYEVLTGFRHDRLVCTFPPEARIEGNVTVHT